MEEQYKARSTVGGEREEVVEVAGQLLWGDKRGSDMAPVHLWSVE